MLIVICKRLVWALAWSCLAVDIFAFVLGVGCLMIDKQFVPFIVEVAVTGSILVISVIVLIIIHIRQMSSNPDDVLGKV